MQRFRSCWLGLFALLTLSCADDNKCFEHWYKVSVKLQNDATTYDLPVFFCAHWDRARLSELASRLLKEYPHAVEPLIELMLKHQQENDVESFQMPCDDGISDASLTRPATARAMDNFFVEIGTSDFGTLHQQLFRDPTWGGLAVEPMEYLLRRLPTRGGLYKENSAIGCAASSGGSATMRRVAPWEKAFEREYFGMAKLLDGDLSRDEWVKSRYTDEKVKLSTIDVAVRCMRWQAITSKHGLTAFNIKSLAREEVDIPGLTLNLKHSGQTITVVKIDAEGAGTLHVAFICMLIWCLSF